MSDYVPQNNDTMRLFNDDDDDADDTTVENLHDLHTIIDDVETETHGATDDPSLDESSTSPNHGPTLISPITRSDVQSGRTSYNSSFDHSPILAMFNKSVTQHPTNAPNETVHSTQ
jgi:hypothetical protein